MNSSRHGERSGSELVFATLRALMNAYQLWGAHSRCHLSELSVLLHASEDWLWGVMAYLDAEGLVSLDRSSGTVCLTPSAARTLMTGVDGVESEEASQVRRAAVVELRARRRAGSKL